MRRVIARACLCTCLKHWRRAKKAHLVGLKLYYTIVKIILSGAATRGVLYKKVFLKSAKSTGKHLRQILFFNKFTVAAVVFTYPLNLKIFERSL